jgi:hypothetical protein
LGRHTTNLTVFADATGSRTRALRIGIRTAAAVLVAATIVVLISLLSGVPMPGFTRPARLPTQHPAAQPGNQYTAAGPTPQVVLAVSSPPGVPTTPEHATPAPAAPPTSPASLPTSTPAPSSTTPRATASSSAPGHTHGNKPSTPPGHTRHP